MGVESPTETHMQKIDAIVPAHNESPTIGRVIAALQSSPHVRRVLVIDDGSQDETCRMAKRAGATVLRAAKNKGKGQAMLAGFRYSDAEHVGFFDADLLTLRPDHVSTLVETTFAHALDMCCGLRDYGLWNPVQLLGPIITGERVCSRELLELIDHDLWSGYAIETAMNDAARRGGKRTGCVLLDNLMIRNKTAKTGFFSGMLGHFKMAREIKKTERLLEARNLSRTDLGEVRDGR